MEREARHVTLRRKQDQVLLRFAEGDRELPVRIVWARPVSGRGEEICFLDEDKREVLMLAGLDGLDEQSRRIAEKELEKRYLIARVTRVNRTTAQFGSRYWDVETDRGRRRFAMKDPHRNIVWVTDDHLIMRDTLGNRYEIRSLAELDASSRAQVEKVT
jgi:hypothetical protein